MGFGYHQMGGLHQQRLPLMELELVMTTPSQRAKEAARTYAFCAENELVQAFATLEAEAHARGKAEGYALAKAEAAKIIHENQIGFSANEAFLIPRYEGNQDGLAYAAAIEKMEMPKP